MHTGHALHGLNEAPRPTLTMWDAANLYKVSHALFALHDTGVLELIAERELTATEVADALQLQREPVETLLQLLAAHGLICRGKLGFSVDADARAVLPLVALEAHQATTHITAPRISASLRGAPPLDPMTQQGAASIWPLYIKAMHVGARSLAPHLYRAARIAPGARVLDLGGADGSLCSALDRLCRGITATVVDRAINEAAFKRQLEQHDADAQARFGFVAGDLKHPRTFSRLLSEADVVIASNVMHLLSDADRTSLLRCIKSHARPDTQLIVYDQFVQSADPRSASSLVVDWLLCGHRFDCSEREFSERLAELGFARLTTRRTVKVPGALVLAHT